MKLYWSPRSPFVRKVMICAHEIGIFERIDKIPALVSMSRFNAEVSKVNPLGRIPTLICDDGAVLYDSGVICEYLDARYGNSRLFPAEGARRWTALRRHALGDGMLETSVLWRAHCALPAAQQSPELIAAFGRKISSALAAIESEDLERDAIDIGHVTIGSAFGYLDFRFGELDWRARHPRSMQWFAAFAARASMQQTLPYQES